MRKKRKPAVSRVRSAVFVVLSIAVAAGCTWGTVEYVRYWQDRLTLVTTDRAAVPVVVASRELIQGMPIGPDDVHVELVQAAYVPRTVLADPELVIGSVPAERILEHELIRKERLATKKGSEGMGAIVPPGLRAVSIDIDDASAVSGFLQPGNYVDVIATVRTKKGDPPRTVTVLQTVQLLAVDTKIEPLGTVDARKVDTKQVPSVTLAVTPLQAETLTHAHHMQKGVTLTLRNDVDVTRITSHGAVADALIGRSDRPAVPVRALPAVVEEPAGATLTLIKGTRTETRHVDSTGRVVNP